MRAGLMEVVRDALASPEPCLGNPLPAPPGTLVPAAAAAPATLDAAGAIAASTPVLGTVSSSNNAGVSQGAVSFLPDPLSPATAGMLPPGEAATSANPPNSLAGMSPRGSSLNPAGAHDNEDVGAGGEVQVQGPPASSGSSTVGSCDGSERDFVMVSADVPEESQAAAQGAEDKCKEQGG